MRTLGSKGEVTEKLLREAGIRLIARHGYDAVSLRHLAKEVGIQAGSLYNYISNKQDFLHALMGDIIRDLNNDMEQAMAGLDDPLEMLRAFIRVHILFHTKRKDEVFIGNMELRSLTDENRADIVKMRDEYEDRLDHILKKGQESGIFRFSNRRTVRLALFAMLTQIANWYSPKGKESISSITEEYIDLAVAMLRVPEEHLMEAA
ncbi:TetR/AcrR family transcriptional regulator [Martelella soudanensis]|uniref:TetR/AcrR family transcriptional regulator n=1 Tax=unclassified Martelella TaxID=2629616 RepID=UPI0015DF84BD|nr:MULTISPECIES: TetR/AcrR family transcriptional regulator [unclassified Martelella]